MTADFQFSRRPTVARLIQTSLLLVVSASAILLLAAKRGNQVVLGLVALAAIPVPALYYIVARWRYRARRKRTETAAFSHLRAHLDGQKSEWQHPSASARFLPKPPRRQLPIVIPAPVAAFRDMGTSVAPCVPDPVLVVVDATLPYRPNSVAGPPFPVAALPGELMSQVSTAAEPGSSVSG